MKGNASTHIFTKQGRENYERIFNHGSVSKEETGERGDKVGEKSRRTIKRNSN